MNPSITLEQLDYLRPCCFNSRWAPLLKKYGCRMSLSDAVSAGVSEPNLWWVWVHLDEDPALLSLIEYAKLVFQPYQADCLAQAIDAATRAVLCPTDANRMSARAWADRVVHPNRKLVVGSLDEEVSWVVCIVALACGARDIKCRANWASKASEYVVEAARMSKTTLPTFTEVYTKAYTHD